MKRITSCFRFKNLFLIIAYNFNIVLIFERYLKEYSTKQNK